MVGKMIGLCYNGWMKKTLFLSTLTMAFNCHAITAQSWLVADNDQIIQGRNTEQVRPIASITKLVTAMVYLDDQIHPDLNLLKRAIVASDNKAANDLCNQHSQGRQKCIYLMNYKMSKMGLHNTHFIEPTGLSVFNSSTAEELITIVRMASSYPAIVAASQIQQMTLNRRTYRNTNPTVSKYDTVISKTGFINKAGGCIVVMIKTETGTRTAIVLGSKNTRTRIPEINSLLKI